MAKNDPLLALLAASCAPVSFSGPLDWLGQSGTISRLAQRVDTGGSGDRLWDPRGREQVVDGRAVDNLTEALQRQEGRTLALLVERHWSFLIRVDDQLVRRSLRAIPPELLSTHPTVALVKLIFEPDSTQARAIGEPYLQQILTGFDDILDVRVRLSAGLSAVITLRERGAYLAAATLGRRLITLASRIGAPDDDEDVSPAAVFFHVGDVCFLAGDFDKAERYLATAYRKSSPFTTHAYEAAGKLALLHVLRGESHLARIWIDRGHKIESGIDDRWPPNQEGVCFDAAQMMLAIDRLDWNRFHQHSRAADVHTYSDDWVFVLYARARAALLLDNQRGMIGQLHDLREGLPDHFSTGSLPKILLDAVEAALWLSLDEFDQAQGLVSRFGDHPFEKITAARYHLLTRQPRIAEQVAAESSWPASTSRRERLNLLILIATADLRTRVHSPDRVRLLRRIVIETAAETEPWLFTFALADRDLIELLPQYVPELQELATVLNELDPPRPFAADPDQIEITPRERTVLELLAENRVVNEIAAALQVSPSTIRNQRKSLYRKLRATSRGHAIEIARRSGLLTHRRTTLCP